MQYSYNHGVISCIIDQTIKTNLYSDTCRELIRDTRRHQHLRFCQKDVVHVTNFCTVLYSFSPRRVNIWNSLPNYVVGYVASVDSFKTRLDKFWRFQDAMFDWKAHLARIRDLSECAHLSM